LLGRERGDAGLDALGRPEAGGRVRPAERAGARVPPPPAGEPAPEPVAAAVAVGDGHGGGGGQPGGVVGPPAAGQAAGTLAAAALAHAPTMAGVGGPRRPGIVHRLDKGTSGLIVLAKTPAAYDALTAQLARRSVARRYLGLVHGAVRPVGGVIDKP